MIMPIDMFSPALSSGPPLMTSSILIPGPAYVGSGKIPKEAVASAFGREAAKRAPLWLTLSSPSISLSSSAKS